MAAWVRRTPYERDGVIVRGAWHFAPGAKVYVEPPFSGDGWERAYMVGRHRETAQWTRLIGPRARLRGFHVEEVTDPIAVDLLDSGASWERDPRLSAWMDRIDATARVPRVAAWSDEAWRGAVERAWTPSPDALAACAGRVMDCDASRAAAWARDGSLGARLHAVETGRWSPDGGDPVRGAAHAWELLAPHAMVDDPARRFVTVSHEDPRATAHPSTLGAAVLLAADAPSMLAAEEIARELAATLGATPLREVTWRVGTLAALQGYLEALEGDEPKGPSACVLALGRALLRDDDDRAQELVRGDTALPWGGVFDLVSRGYGIAALGDGRAELVAAEPSRARIKPDAW